MLHFFQSGQYTEVSLYIDLAIVAGCFAVDQHASASKTSRRGNLNEIEQGNL
jgi:hypothetical protein